MGQHHPAATSQEAQSLAERVAAGMYARDRASQAMGMRIAAIGPGYAELTMTVRADMLNGHAICHGGFIFTLADSAFAFACNSYNLTRSRRAGRSISSRRRAKAMFWPRWRASAASAVAPASTT